jgi:hypothetical protein
MRCVGAAAAVIISGVGAKLKHVISLSILLFTVSSRAFHVQICDCLMDCSSSGWSMQRCPSRPSRQSLSIRGKPARSLHPTTHNEHDSRLTQLPVAVKFLQPSCIWSQTKYGACKGAKLLLSVTGMHIGHRKCRTA